MDGSVEVVIRIWASNDSNAWTLAWASVRGKYSRLALVEEIDRGTNFAVRPVEVRGRAGLPALVCTDEARHPGICVASG